MVERWCSNDHRGLNMLYAVYAGAVNYIAFLDWPLKHLNLYEFKTLSTIRYQYRVSRMNYMTQ